MLVSKIMDTSIFTPKYFYCFEGNVCNMAVTRKRPRRQRANVSFCFLYIAVSENYNVQNSPLGMCVCMCVCVGGGSGGERSVAGPVKNTGKPVKDTNTVLYLQIIQF